MKEILHLSNHSEKDVVWRLLQLCLYDYTSFEKLDLNKDGEYDYEYFDDYFTEDYRLPYILKVNNEIIGLLLVRLNIDDRFHSVAEFFIVNNYKGIGYGQKAIRELFTKYKGNWEIEYNINNVRGKHFWNKIISEITKNKYVVEKAGIDREKLSFSN